MTKTLTLLPVLLAVNIPPCPSPVDRRLMGGREGSLGVKHYLPIFLGWKGSSRFGHQVGASAQDLGLGNRFHLRGS